MRHHHETFVKLRLNREAPPWAFTKKSHGITFSPWGTTTRSHQEIHGITSWPWGTNM